MSEGRFLGWYIGEDYSRGSPVAHRRSRGYDSCYSSLSYGGRGESCRVIVSLSPSGGVRGSFFSSLFRTSTAGIACGGFSLREIEERPPGRRLASFFSFLDVIPGRGKGSNV